jgi:hypothetical protein
VVENKRYGIEDCAKKNQFNQNCQLDKFSVVDGFSKAEKEAWAAYEGSLNDETVFDDESVEFNDFKEAESDPLAPEWGKDKVHGFELVGNGKVTHLNGKNECGRFGAFWGCLNVEKHDNVTLDGENFKGKVYVKKVFRSCDKPTCPVCFLKGWAVNEAKKIERIIKAAEKKYGLAEHAIVGIPQSDYGLSVQQMRLKVGRVLVSRGIIGGCRIFHAFRYRSHSKDKGGVHYPRGWFYAPHFHCLAFLRDSYSSCRKCENHFEDGVLDRKQCMGCPHFEGLTRRMFEKEEKRRAGSGYIVKIKGKRKTIGGTAWYQLSHSAVKTGDKKFHVVGWFGVCASRKNLQVGKEDKEVSHGVCPHCQSPLVKLRYTGAKGLLFWLRRFWEKDFTDDYLDAEGVPQWKIDDKK